MYAIRYTLRFPLNGTSMIMFALMLVLKGSSRTDINGLVVSNIKKISLKQKIFNNRKIAKKYQHFSDNIKKINVTNKSKTQYKFTFQ